MQEAPLLVTFGRQLSNIKHISLFYNRNTEIESYRLVYK